jgi:hypothetical protein
VAEEEDDDHDIGTGSHYPGGKLFGKSLRPSGGVAEGENDDDEDDDSDDDDDDSEEEEEEDTSKPKPQQYAVRGSGKQLTSSGKYLRPYVTLDQALRGTLLYVFSTQKFRIPFPSPATTQLMTMMMTRRMMSRKKRRLP